MAFLGRIQGRNLYQASQLYFKMIFYPSARSLEFLLLLHHPMINDFETGLHIKTQATLLEMTGYYMLKDARKVTWLKTRRHSRLSKRQRSRKTNILVKFWVAGWATSATNIYPTNIQLMKNKKFEENQSEIIELKSYFDKALNTYWCHLNQLRTTSDQVEVKLLRAQIIFDKNSRHELEGGAAASFEPTYQTWTTVISLQTECIMKVKICLECGSWKW